MQGNISKLDAHLSAINQRISQQAASIHDLEQRVVSLETSEPNGQIEKLQRLEKHVNYLERKQRERNIRLIGIPESQYENCYDIVVSIIQELQVYADVEVAHRTGRSGQQPRHIIARVTSVQGKLDILRAQKHFLKNKAYFFVEDLTKKDYETKRALKPVIDKARYEGKRCRFRDGKLYVNGEHLVSNSVHTTARPVTTMETAEDYGASSQFIESPHQVFTSTSTLVHSSQNPNQQLPHPSPAHQTGQQYDQKQQHIIDQHQQRRQQQDRPLQQQERQQHGQQQGQQQQYHPAPRFTREPYSHPQHHSERFITQQRAPSPQLSHPPPHSASGLLSTAPDHHKHHKHGDIPYSTKQMWHLARLDRLSIQDPGRKMAKAQLQK